MRWRAFAHMKGKLHLSDELTGNMEFLLPCAGDAFRSAVLGTLLPAMGSIYQRESTQFHKTVATPVSWNRGWYWMLSMRAPGQW